MFHNWNINKEEQNIKKKWYKIHKFVLLKSESFQHEEMQTNIQYNSAEPSQNVRNKKKKKGIKNLFGLHLK